MREFILYYLLHGRLFKSLFGFSPFELVFGHTVRGPLKLLKEKWLTETSYIYLLDYVSDFKKNVFLPIPGNPLQARYYGPYEIESKISDVNYVVSTPDSK